MKTIDVEGLPEPMVQVLENLVRVFCQDRNGQPARKSQRVELPLWPDLGAGTLRREEIYDVAGSGIGRLL